MSSHAIHIIGLGVAELADLGGSANHALQHADVIVGAGRQLATVKPLLQSGQREYITLPKLSELEVTLDRCKGRSVAVLASGDPLYYGIGSWFSQRAEQYSPIFYPAVSSMQAACHRLGVSLQDIDVVSLHGRPVESLRRHLRQHQCLLVLTDENSQPQRLARECLDAGFSESIVTVCERLGYATEKVRTFSAAELVGQHLAFDSLHVSHIIVRGEGGQQPEFPGIPDDHFITGQTSGKGMISKREVRLAILSLMQVSGGDVVWDIGAGCGGVSVEMALWQPRATVYAIEKHADRLDCLHQNRDKFGVVKNLHTVAGRAPEILAPLPRPDKIFIGGSDGELPNLLDSLWAQLPVGGCLVASSIVDESRRHLHEFAKRRPSESMETVEVGVRRGQWDTGELHYVAKLPVEIYRFSKLVER